MLFTLTNFYTAAAALVLATAQTGASTLPQATDVYTIPVGNSFAVAYEAPDLIQPASIILHRNDNGRLVSLGKITAAATEGTFNWTPSRELASDKTYVLEIQQGSFQHTTGEFKLAASDPAKRSTRDRHHGINEKRQDPRIPVGVVVTQQSASPPAPTSADLSETVSAVMSAMTADLASTASADAVTSISAASSMTSDLNSGLSGFATSTRNLFKTGSVRAPLPTPTGGAVGGVNGTVISSIVKPSLSPSPTTAKTPSPSTGAAGRLATSGASALAGSLAVLAFLL